MRGERLVEIENQMNSDSMHKTVLKYLNFIFRMFNFMFKRILCILSLVLSRHVNKARGVDATLSQSQ